MRASACLRLLALFVLPAALAGCFLSETRLIGEADAYAPYATIEFQEEGDDDTIRLTREGAVYRGATDGDTIELTFRQLEEGLVLVQFREDLTQERYLYSLLRIDEAAGTAKAYAALARGTEAGPGLVQCENVICIVSLDAYLAHARALEASGGEPEVTWRFTGTR